MIKFQFLGDREHILKTNIISYNARISNILADSIVVGNEIMHWEEER